MEHTTGVVDLDGRPQGFDEPTANQVQKTISEIVQSTPFRSSKQSQVLVRYIVDQTLAGHFEMLKERIIGANVFGRPADYDTNDDPIVRARAAEVRKRLAQYYQTAREEAIRIDIPSGSYKATFEWHDEKSARSTSTTYPQRESSHSLIEAVPPLGLEVPTPATARSLGRSRLWRWLTLIAVSILALALSGRHYFASSEERAFNQFWSPVFDNSNTVLIYLGSNVVYELAPSYLDAYHLQHPRTAAEEMGLESYVPLSRGATFHAEDLFAAKDTFVTIGDVAATTKFVSLLVRRNKKFDVRYGNDVAYGDLRQSPTLLIGAHNNLWTIAMTDNLRFVFDSHLAIQDRSDPRKHWSAASDFSEDYAIVSRILSSKTGSTIITAAGIGHAGTRAAAEFLTNPQAILALIRILPEDWKRKNVQIVLHTSVIHQIPSAPDVVATYCW